METRLCAFVYRDTASGFSRDVEQSSGFARKAILLSLLAVGSPKTSSLTAVLCVILGAGAAATSLTAHKVLE